MLNYAHMLLILKTPVYDFFIDGVVLSFSYTYRLDSRTCWHAQIKGRHKYGTCASLSCLLLCEIYCTSHFWQINKQINNQPPRPTQPPTLSEMMENKYRWWCGKALIGPTILYTWWTEKTARRLASDEFYMQTQKIRRLKPLTGRTRTQPMADPEIRGGGQTWGLGAMHPAGECRGQRPRWRSGVGSNAICIMLKAFS